MNNQFLLKKKWFKFVTFPHHFAAYSSVPWPPLNVPSSSFSAPRLLPDPVLEADWNSGQAVAASSSPLPWCWHLSAGQLPGPFLFSHEPLESVCLSLVSSPLLWLVSQPGPSPPTDLVLSRSLCQWCRHFEARKQMRIVQQ